MEYDHLNQWRNQQRQLEQGSAAKIPRIGVDSDHTETALPLFVPEPSAVKISSLSAFPDSLTTTAVASPYNRFPRLGGGLFSISQWQELELQALIFKYMLAGAVIPSELLHSIKTSFINAPSCCHYPHQQLYQHYQPAAMMQSGYWGRGSMDPEPGRCRRTDGKKWRCSRDVVPGQKYCERHVHRGRNRSRKPVEIPTPAAGVGNGGGGGGLRIANATIASSPASMMSGGSNFSLSGSPSIELLHLNQRSSENRVGNHDNNMSGEAKPDGQVLRHFFDDWPRSNQKSNGGLGNNSSPATSTTCLSISTPGNNPSSDFSLKLSTGNVDERDQSREMNGGGAERRQMNWGGGWGTHQMSSMGGGPLAEALRSSSITNSSSPTSVLHELRRGSISETSSVST
ncbi:hypothetical protein C5167_028337 [Papaver somniferum]|uniref:growth-regulating factor 3-like n=1 Tax=Papaver somniferum TaxID=3469 RepID=UPI000E6FA2EC|nr:growth-regulating factor 3-like [Papaver somniferum]RZC90245.1 hypothetical protein C5167_028337 [Papaver somniferum]